MNMIHEPYHVYILRVLSRKNFRKVLHQLRSSEGYTTSELADMTRLRSVEVSRVISELKDAEIVETSYRRHYLTTKGFGLKISIEQAIEHFRTSTR